MKRVAIIDYGCGNHQSLIAAFAYLGLETCVTKCPEEIFNSSLVVMPGVGNFGPASINLSQSGLHKTLQELILRNHPVLGICLGMQLLCKSSEESPNAEGLGHFDINIRRLLGGKCNIGWQRLQQTGNLHYSADFGQSRFYFNHGYFADPEDDRFHTIAIGHHYGHSFSAVISKGSVVGVQFHPEKSQASGIKFLGSTVDILGL